MERALHLEVTENPSWFNQPILSAAEIKYQESLSKSRSAVSAGAGNASGDQVKVSQAAPDTTESYETILKRLTNLESDNAKLKKMHSELESRFTALEKNVSANPSTTNVSSSVQNGPSDTQQLEEEAKDDDEDVDLFGSESEDDEEQERLKAERLKAYEAKKSKKPALIAKSNIILDVKPWDDETDMGEMEKLVRGLEADGLVWGAGKLVPLAYGIKKLQISCVVEDDKIGTDWLEESITAFEDVVQSVDVAAFNKV